MKPFIKSFNPDGAIVCGETRDAVEKFAKNYFGDKSVNIRNKNTITIGEYFGEGCYQINIQYEFDPKVLVDNMRKDMV